MLQPDQSKVYRVIVVIGVTYKSTNPSQLFAVAVLFGKNVNTTNTRNVYIAVEIWIYYSTITLPELYAKLEVFSTMLIGNICCSNFPQSRGTASEIFEMKYFQALNISSSDMLLRFFATSKCSLELCSRPVKMVNVSSLIYIIPLKGFL